jgi:diguanylate cyclase (GGDEF)-like protein
MDHQTENKKLHRQLKAFVAQARENEAKLQRFNDQELQLISATSIPELIRLILQQYPRTFRLDCISLTLIDPEYELARMLEDSGLTLEQIPGLQIETDASALQRDFTDTLRPRLGPFVESAHAHRFTPQPSPIRSCAILPLIRRGELIGALNMGSYHPERFLAGSGTEFLERLAAIVAVCLENCANHQRLKQIGMTDPLTRVNNRRYFDQRLGEEVSLAMRQQQALSCMFLDLDHFKRINDSYGHRAGDRVLQEIAKVIATELRHSDVFCRYGGEEFVILLPATDMRESKDIAERIRQMVEAHTFRISDTETLLLTLSIGINCLSVDDGNGAPEALSEGLIARADHAVYQAKSAGRNRVVCHVSDCDE